MTNSFSITSCRVESFEQSSTDKNTIKVNLAMELKLQEKSSVPSYLGDDPFFSAWQNEPNQCPLDQKTLDSLIDNKSDVYELEKFEEYDTIGLTPTRLNLALNTLKTNPCNQSQTNAQTTINETISSLERLKQLFK